MRLAANLFDMPPALLFISQHCLTHPVSPLNIFFRLIQGTIEFRSSCSGLVLMSAICIDVLQLIIKETASIARVFLADGIFYWMTIPLCTLD